MIQLARPTLSANAALKLIQYQAAVDAEETFPAQVTFAKNDFPKKNVVGNSAFDDVKAKLKTMTSGAERCHYCEDSKADEVEHLLPKDVYPNLCSDWNNYLYACGNCNGPKNNKCAVVDTVTNTLVDVTPARAKKNSPPPAPTPPQAGITAIVNPINDNPLDFFFLDLKSGSFKLSELPAPNTKEFVRAKYTLETLRLNDRAFLSEARKKAYGSYKARLTEYIHSRDAGVIPLVQLNKMVTEIQTYAHPTVWQEMKRQHTFIPELNALFKHAPEALGW